MMKTYKTKNAMNDIDFVKEYYKIIGEVEVEFANLVQSKEIEKVFSEVMEKYNLTSMDFFSTEITDYLIEDAEGKIQIGDKFYKFPKYLFAIINKLTFDKINSMCNVAWRKIVKVKGLSEQKNFESKSSFRQLYLEKLKKVLSSVEGHSTIERDKFGRVTVYSDRDKEEFKMRTLYGAVLLTTLNEISREIRTQSLSND